MNLDTDIIFKPNLNNGRSPWAPLRVTPQGVGPRVHPPRWFAAETSRTARQGSSSARLEEGTAGRAKEASGGLPVGGRLRYDLKYQQDLATQRGNSWWRTGWIHGPRAVSVVVVVVVGRG